MLTDEIAAAILNILATDQIRVLTLAALYAVERFGSTSLLSLLLCYLNINFALAATKRKLSQLGCDKFILQLEKRYRMSDRDQPTAREDIFRQEVG